MPFVSPFPTAWADPRNPLNLPTGEWRYQRPLTRLEKCCGCGLCALFCPTGCKQDRGSYFTADLTYCKGCGICAQVCPIEAIALVRERQG